MLAWTSVSLHLFTPSLKRGCILHRRSVAVTHDHMLFLLIQSERYCSLSTRVVGADQIVMTGGGCHL